MQLRGHRAPAKRSLRGRWRLQFGQTTRISPRRVSFDLIGCDFGRAKDIVTSRSFDCSFVSIPRMIHPQASCS